MNVLHIIPGAFHYFDDIRQSAFRLLDTLEAIGIESEAFVLQYSVTNKPEATKSPDEELYSKKQLAPKQRSFQGMVSINDMLTHSDAFDIVHLHVPFLGAGHALRRWRKLHPDKPLVFTYYHSVATPDLFSLGISWYNAYYLPKLAATADAVTAMNDTVPRFVRDHMHFVAISGEPAFMGQQLPPDIMGKLTKDEIVAWKMGLLYTTLIAN